MQDAEVKVDIDLILKNRLVVGSGCVRVLTMQCMMVFLFCKRSHGDGVIWMMQYLEVSLVVGCVKF